MTRALDYFPNARTSPFLRWGASVDWGLIALILLLSVLGLYAVNLASGAAARRLDIDDFHFISRQIVWVPMGLTLMFLMSFASGRYIRLFGLLLTVVALCLMGVIAVMGIEVKGAARWIRIGGITIQPSEFLKPGLAIVSAAALAAWQEDRVLKPLVLVLVCAALALVLLILQPDVGQFILILAMMGVQYFICGAPLGGVIFWLGGAGVACVIGMILFSFSHVQDRILTFLRADLDPTSQISKSLNAVSSGQFWGEGAGNGLYKYELADSHTDFIFAVIAEEHGFVGSVLLLCVYLAIAIRTFVQLRNQANLFVHIAGAGLLFQFLMQAWINMASTLGLIPTKGMTLPLISYGGSSVISICMTLGLLLALTRAWGDENFTPSQQWPQQQQDKETDSVEDKGQ